VGDSKAVTGVPTSDYVSQDANVQIPLYCFSRVVIREWQLLLTTIMSNEMLRCSILQARAVCTDMMREMESSLFVARRYGFVTIIRPGIWQLLEHARRDRSWFAVGPDGWYEEGFRGLRGGSSPSACVWDEPGA
jgi:hypothetical protein